MLYRFKSKLKTQDRLEAFIVGIPNSDKRPYIPAQKNYERKFVRHSNMTTSDLITIYEAPVFDTNTLGICLRIFSVSSLSALPDIWGIGRHLICSQRFKDVIEQNDNFSHQFIPITLIDEKEDKLETDVPYYWFNLRRFIRVKVNENPPAELKFIPTKDEKSYIGEITANQSIYNQLVDIPLWRYFGENTQLSRNTCSLQVFYFNDYILEKLNEGGVKGIELFSKFDGGNEESVVRVSPFKGEKSDL